MKLIMRTVETKLDRKRKHDIESQVCDQMGLNHLTKTRTPSRDSLCPTHDGQPMLLKHSCHHGMSQYIRWLILRMSRMNGDESLLDMVSKMMILDI